MQAERLEMMAKLQEMQKEADAKDELIAGMRAEGEAKEAEVAQLRDSLQGHVEHTHADAKRSGQETASRRKEETERERPEEKRAGVKTQQTRHEKDVREKELALLAAKLGEMLRESPEALQH
eukprot:5650926-Prymnesium_polylepis.1